MVPPLHGIDAAVPDLQEHSGPLAMHGVDHLPELQHSLARVDQRHARRGAALVVDARVALDDEADAGPGVADELPGIQLGRVRARAGSLEHRRPVETVANTGRPDLQW